MAKPHIAPANRWDVLAATVRRKLNVELPDSIRAYLDAKPVRYRRLAANLAAGVRIETVIAEITQAAERGERKAAKRLRDIERQQAGQLAGRRRLKVRHNELRQRRIRSQLHELGWERYKERYPLTTESE